MRRKLKFLCGILLLLLPFFLLDCSPDHKISTEPDTELYITTILTVKDSIQLYDPWITGSMKYNGWAKPIYRIWFDMNGNPDDGPFGNGIGVKQAEVWLDTGRLGFWWQPANAAEHRYWPMFTISESRQIEEEIEAQITNNYKSISVSFPLRSIGNPLSLEMGFMTSPWTTTACDNLGQGCNSCEWLIIESADEPGTFSLTDEHGDMQWPSGLSPNCCDNFDLVKVEVIIENK